MILGRRLDERMVRLQRQGRLGTFAPIKGQEASQLGSVSTLRPTDWMVPSFRETAAMLWRGWPIEKLLLFFAGYVEGGQPGEGQRDLPIAVPVATQLPHAVAIEQVHDQALGDYTKASELKPDDAILHYGRGTALQNLRRYEEALAAYDATLRLAPGHTNARNNHGHANRALKRYDAALQDFDELVRIQPDFVHAYFNRGLSIAI